MSVHFHNYSPLYIVYTVATAKCMLNVESVSFYEQLVWWFRNYLKIKFLITTDEVEERVDTARDSKENKLISVGDSEEGESSSVGDSEEEADPRVQQQVGEIVKAFSTMAVCSVS